MALTGAARKPIRHERRHRLDGADFTHQGFCLLRTPFLPVDELESWSAALLAPEAGGDVAALEVALAADRKMLRRRLSELLARPAVLEALHVASPALLEGLEPWRRDPDSRKGRRAEEALMRYAFRMAMRATPFGLFAGCTIGGVGPSSRLRLAPQSAYRRHSRLDMSYLLALCEQLNQDRELRRALLYRPSSSIYRAAGRLRYAEARYGGSMVNYHLVAVEPDEFLDVALARARDGATTEEIAAAVVSADVDGEITFDDAAGYVDTLIDNQLLMSELWPVLTGDEAVHGLLGTLQRVAPANAAVSTLRAVQEELDALDGDGVGSDPHRYARIIRGLEPLPERADRANVFQVDLFKPGEVVLPPAVLDEIARGIEALHRLEPAQAPDLLQGFRERFVERYGMQRRVPLLEALDVEIGVGRPLGAMGGDNSPLLEGLDFAPAESAEKVRWGPREELILGKLMRAQATGAFEIAIDEDDLQTLETPRRLALPDSFQTMAVVGAASEEALDAGEFLVWVRSVFGPSGARLAGRFCQGDAAIARAVSEQLRAEEALDPDALFAEVVHVGAGRTGNIASRPVLRDWEIPYLGASGAPRDRQIPVDDLLVTVEDDEVILVSARLRRRVMPRLTSAHNFGVGSLALYRFLGAMQEQGVRAGLEWSWRPFEKQPFLPRVRCGRAILSRAYWRVTSDEISQFAGRTDAERHESVRRWREQRAIPRCVLYSNEESELLVDLENVLSLDTFLASVKGAAEMQLTELWHGFDQLPVRGPEGRFVHELVVPFARQRTPTRRFAPSLADAGERILTPMSRWLYLKLYTGSVTADQVLPDAVAPLAARAMESGAADRWFFLRYADPQHHLRVRFGGEPARLREIIDLLPEYLDPLLREGRIARWQLDTYEREVERYGGAAGVELSERVFHVDSEAVLAALEELSGDRGLDWRWRFALLGIDRLFSDFGFDLAARRTLLSGLRNAFGNEIAAGPLLTQQLAQRLRETGEELFALLTIGIADPEHPLAGSMLALERRSQRLAPLVAELRALESRGELTTSIESLVCSYAHMFVNRMIRSDQRAHELVLYDLLHRLTISRMMTERRRPAG